MDHLRIIDELRVENDGLSQQNYDMNKWLIEKDAEIIDLDRALYRCSQGRDLLIEEIRLLEMEIADNEPK